MLLRKFLFIYICHRCINSGLSWECRWILNNIILSWCNLYGIPFGKRLFESSLGGMIKQTIGGISNRHKHYIDDQLPGPVPITVRIGLGLNHRWIGFVVFSNNYKLTEYSKGVDKTLAIITKIFLYKSIFYIFFQ